MLLKNAEEMLKGKTELKNAIETRIAEIIKEKMEGKQLSEILSGCDEAQEFLKILMEKELEIKISNDEEKKMSIDCFFECEMEDRYERPLDIGFYGKDKLMIVEITMNLDEYDDYGEYTFYWLFAPEKNETKIRIQNFTFLSKVYYGVDGESVNFAEDERCDDFPELWGHASNLILQMNEDSKLENMIVDYFSLENVERNKEVVDKIAKANLEVPVTIGMDEVYLEVNGLKIHVPLKNIG